MPSVPLNSPGFLYVLASASLTLPSSDGGEPQPLYKVGFTTNSPFERARQLTAQTASATQFHVVHFRATKDAFEAEKRAHERLDEYRINDSREYFCAPLLTIIKVVDEVTGHVGMARMPDTPFAYLFATFPDDGSPRELTKAERTQCRELAAELIVGSVA